MEALQLVGLVQGYRHSAVVLTALRVGVFEAIGRGSATAEDLAGRLGLDRRALETVLLALASDGVLLAEAGRFRIDPESAELLLPDGRMSQVNIFNHDFGLMQRWVRLEETLRNGRPVPRPEAEQTEEAMRHFICGMADVSRLSSLEVAEKFDFSPYRRLLDVGGGPATHSITFARKNPELRCVVLDLPGPIGIAREEIAKASLEERIEARAGDFLADELGEGFDVVYISNIIHMLGEAQTRALIEKSRRALAPGGVLIIKEFFLEDDRVSPPFAAMFSVNMLVGTEAGKSYTLAETRRMMAEAGFGDFETLEVAMNSRLLIGRLKA